MPNRSARQDIYAAHGSSWAQRIFLTAAIAACVALAWWLLVAGGIALTGTWLGRAWQPGDATRRIFLALALTVYFLRLLFTQFMFLKRALSWGEAAMIAAWILCIYLLLAIAGGTNATAMTGAGAAGVALFLLGSWMNSYAEYARHMWKQRLENRGRLYTLGLFRISRHPNYLGDLISFSGLCIMAGRWITAAIPLIMLAGFVFANIPMLDAHLRAHYGAAFDEYAVRTRKLIPFIY